ncbi:MAG: dihydroneopterin aldolase [Myxococcota bacterium]
MTDWIQLRQLNLSCIVGLWPTERDRLQPITLDVELGLDLGAAACGRLEESVDYAVLASQLTFIAQHGRFRMLESMAMAMLRFILAPPGPGQERAMVERAQVTITKPEALQGRALPRVVLSRTQETVDPLPSQTQASVGIQPLLETRHTGVYHVRLGPQKAWSLPDGASALVLGGALESGPYVLEPDQPVPSGDPTVANRSSTDGALLVVTHPPLNSSLSLSLSLSPSEPSP